MAEITPGIYTVRELLGLVDFDLDKEAAVDYGDGVDRRRVKVGGLPFDDVEKTVRVPEASEGLEITLDGEVVATINVKSDQSDAEPKSLVLAPDDQQPVQDGPTISKPKPPKPTA